jgi:hypothetical protein
MEESTMSEEIQWCVPDPTSATKTIQPLAPGNAASVVINHENRTAIQYEFYIPAAVYYHTAVQAFRQSLGQLAPGATIFRGATGVWMGEEEDVYIYRTLIKYGEHTPETLRPGLRSLIQAMMASLATWKEASQKEVLFTETLVCMNQSFLVAVKPAVATGSKKVRPPKTRKP